MEHLAECSYCGHKARIDVMLVGSEVICEGCSKTFIVPLTNIEAGEVQDNYWVQSEIGSGNISQTFIAKMTVSDTKIYLKVLARSFTQDEERLNAFIDAVCAWQCPDIDGILTAVDSGTMQDHLFIAFEYAEGTFLDQRIANRGPLDEALTLEACRHTAKRLQAAWDKYGLVHGNIRPSNMLIDMKNHVYLVDGGVDKRLLFSDWSSGNHKGDVVSYLAPELLEGSTILDFRTDMYGLGASMFCLLTGKAPFSGAPDAAISDILQGNGPDLSSIEGVSPRTVQLMERLMQVNAADRPQTWADVLSELAVPEGVEKKTGRISHGSILGLDVDELTPKKRYPKWLIYTLGAAVLFVLMLAGIGSCIALRKLDEPSKTGDGVRRFEPVTFARRMEAYRIRAQKDPKQAAAMVRKVSNWLEQTDDASQIAELKALQEVLKKIAPSDVPAPERKRPAKPFTRPAFKPTPQPIAHWSFDKAENNLVFDLGEGAVHADMPTRASLSPGWRGTAIKLNGENTKLFLRQGDKLTATDTFSWIAWVNGFDMKEPEGPIAAQVSPRRDWVKGSKAFGLDSGDLVFKVFGAEAVRFKGLPKHDWFQVGVTAAGGNVRLYVNGKKVNEQKLAKALFGSTGFRGMLGRCPEFSRNREYFRGMLDDVRRYAVELTPEQMRTVYEKDSWFSLWDDKELVAHWPLNKPGDEGLADAGPNDFSLSAWDATKEEELGFRPAGRFDKVLKGGDLVLAEVGKETLDQVQEGSFTLVFRYKPTTLPRGVRPANTAVQFLIGKRSWPDAQRRVGKIPKRFWTSQHLGVLYNPDGKISFEWTEGKTREKLMTRSGLPLKKEAFVAVIRDKLHKRVTLWISGQNEVSKKLAAWGISSDYRKQNWQLGAYCPASSRWQYPADGVMKDVWIFNRALCHGELQAIRDGRYD